MLSESGIEAELIDLRSIKPWDRELVFASVRKTGRLVVADSGWQICGVASEIVATVACHMFGQLKSPISRVTLPDIPAPVSAGLEKACYPAANSIVAAVRNMLDLKRGACERNSHWPAELNISTL